MLLAIPTVDMSMPLVVPLCEMQLDSGPCISNCDKLGGNKEDRG